MKQRITKNIAIKRRINITDELKDFIFTNINYRRKVYNDFVEESRKYENLKDFNPLSYKTTYFNEIEKPNNVYDKYCVGISEQVAKDMKKGIKSMRGNKRLYQSKFRFKKYDKFRGSFKVHCKPGYRENSLNVPHYISRFHVLDNLSITFSKKRNKLLYISLKEPIFDTTFYTNDIYPYFYDKKNQYYYSEEDIKEISFVHELGKFYIVLFIEVTYLVDKDKILNKDICGIDLGIHNPCMLYDGANFKEYRFSEKELKRIEYLERRARRLQHIMDHKLEINNGNKSHNYYKVLKKFRITHKKIFNIRLNWRRKVAKEISDKYCIICIDNFKQPGKEVHEEFGLTRDVIRRLNASNRVHGTYNLYESIIHSIEKTGGMAIKSPKHTTRTCSNCGHKNKKLLLSQRYLHCEKCNTIIDRDKNAAVNCYNYLV